MADSIDILPAREEHCELLAPYLREADLAEVKASGGIGPLRALSHSLAVSVQAWTAVAGGEVFAMWGLAAPWGPGTVGVPWMLGSDAVARHQKDLLTVAREWVGEWARQYALLINCVDARNTASLRFLRHLGFTILPPITWGVEHRPFHPFQMLGR